MEFDLTQIAIGAGGMVAALLVFGTSGAFLHYYFTLVDEVKRKALARDHRPDLKLVRMAVIEVGLAHLGYFALTVTIIATAWKTDVAVPDPRFYIMVGMVLLFWYLLVPGHGVLRFREMLFELRTPSESRLGANAEQSPDSPGAQPAVVPFESPGRQQA